MDILDVKVLKAWADNIYEHTAAVQAAIRVEIQRIEKETEQFEKEKGE